MQAQQRTHSPPRLRSCAAAARSSRRSSWSTRIVTVVGRSFFSVTTLDILQVYGITQHDSQSVVSIGRGTSALEAAYPARTSRRGWKLCPSTYVNRRMLPWLRSPPGNDTSVCRFATFLILRRVVHILNATL